MKWIKTDSEKSLNLLRRPSNVTYPKKGPFLARQQFYLPKGNLISLTKANKLEIAFTKHKPDQIEHVLQEGEKQICHPRTLKKLTACKIIWKY